MLQAKKRFWGKKPGFDVGDILHIGVNAIFVAVIYAAVELWGLVPLAVVLVLLSKWRVLAVQPRFWLPNVKANLVDLIVGVSTIILAYQTENTGLGLVIMALYLGWLLFLKPQTTELLVGLQAFWAQFLGIVAIFAVPTFTRQPLSICVFVWVITWSAARHFFSNYEEPHYRTLGLIWAFLMTQLTWVSLHWMQYYSIFNLKLTTVAVIISVLSAALGSIYHSYKKNTLHRGVLIENAFFAGTLLIVILALSKWSAGL